MYFVDCCRNLYKSQKLLSLSLEGDMPVWDMGGVWRREDVSLPDYLGEDELSSLPAVLLVVLLLVLAVSDTTPPQASDSPASLHDLYSSACCVIALD
ncbi:hypothetical protein J6590_010327 [Homalodisca vitripennis]|nr:hypothetical protein J6590_010327 [Homalodisca vitripennis]